METPNKWLPSAFGASEFSVIYIPWYQTYKVSSLRKILAGLALLFTALGLDYVGSGMGSLPVLVLSMVLAIAGALVGLRGMIELIGERLSQ